MALLVHLPSKSLPYYHMYTATVVAVLCMATFALCSISDPGTVTPENAKEYITRFPYDGILFKAKRCGTCEFDKPARSKHCSVCRRCVAKYDHHCIWINNCVGLNNHRYFLLFILVNLLAMVYGGIAIPVFVYDKLAHVIHRPWVHYETGETFTIARRPLMLFDIIVSSGLLLGFLVFHLYLIASGKTTNENFKWADVKLQSASIPKKNFKNVYHRGILQNFIDVLFPFKHRHFKNH